MWVNRKSFFLCNLVEQLVDESISWSTENELLPILTTNELFKSFIKQKYQIFANANANIFGFCSDKIRDCVKIAAVGMGAEPYVSLV